MSTPAMPENKNSLLKTFSFVKVYSSQSLSWRTFVMSSPLQTGIWLLCRLRPPSCTLAFSRPLRVKQFRISPVPGRNVLVTLGMPTIRRVVRGILPSVPPVRSSTLGEFSSQAKSDKTCTSTFWSSVSTGFTCNPLRRFNHRFLSSA